MNREIKDISLAWRFVLWFFFIALLPLASFGYLSLHQSEDALRGETLNRMSRLADKKTLQIKTYLDERMQNVQLLARSRLVEEAFSELPRAYARHRADSAEYRRAAKPFWKDFASYIGEGGDTQFYDVFLITPQGEIVFTHMHEADFATNLITGPYRDSQLAQVFRESLMTLDSRISGFEHYAPSNAPAAFISAPVISEGVLLGVIAFQLDAHHVYEVAMDNSGLGVTGETPLGELTGDGEAVFVAPLRHDPQAAMRRKIDLKTSAVPMRYALSGDRGSGVVIDYSGKQVVAAWRYLPELRWGMVVKMDADEAFAPIYRQRENLLGILLLLAMLGGFAAFYFGRQMVRRLKDFAQNADAIAQGDLSKRVNESGRDEIGALAHSFNRMTGSLQTMYRTLEDRVEERTGDLYESNKLLQDEIIEREHIEAALREHEELLTSVMKLLPVGVWILNTDGKIIFGNAVGQQIWAGAHYVGIEQFGEYKGRWLESKKSIEPHEWAAARAIEKGETSIEEEVEIECFDGTHKIILNSALPLRKSDGSISGAIIVNQDITGRKHAEEVLKRHKQVLDITSDGFWMVDAMGNLQMANQAYANLSGYSVEELAHMHISQLEAMEQSVEEVKAHIGKIIVSGSDKFETRHRHKDGHEIDIEVTTSFLPESQQFAVFLRDITGRKRVQLQLQHNQDLLNEAQRLGQLGSWELDLASGELWWSDETYRIFELDPSKFIPSYENFLNVIHPDDRDKVNQAYTQSLQDRQPYDVVHRLLFADDRVKWVREHCNSEFDKAGKPLRSVGAVQDITAQKLAEESMRVAAATFETHEAILITDTNANILRVNQAFQDITGFSSEEVLGKNPRILSSGRHDKAFYEAMWQQLLSTGSWTGEIWDRRKNGQVYPKWATITAVKNEHGETTEYVAIFSDITERKQAEEEIRNLAFYDALTGLPNRRLLLDRFRLALSVSARSHHYGAVLFLDMDRFKTLNDTLGHDYGDLMLTEVAERIRSCVREVDTVARLGGDEFVVLLEEVDEAAEEASQIAAQIAEKIRAALAVPYQLKGHEYHSSPSIGVCLYRGSDESVDELLKHSDMAMYQAKGSGRNAVHFFDPAMQLAVETHAAIEADLRRAVPGKQLRLYYQIQVDNDLRPLGAEALVRWIHPKRGIVSPAQFIHIAEESSLILDIGHWVLETACRQLEAWSKNELTRDLTLAVNVSGQQFRLHDYVEKVAAAIGNHRVDPSRLKLELTESVVLNDVADVVAKMHALKALGVKLSMDDFGTGYSSLSYLKQLPLDQIKIDQSFVRNIATDPNDAVMVQTIIVMAQNYRLNVIAEGVETEAQLEFLKKNGCMAYQGFLFSKPVPVEEFEALLGELQGN
jgi:diguanylate cyclase (GGDEF)-like protein/PAS domain S-box-containing protein